MKVDYRGATAPKNMGACCADRVGKREGILKPYLVINKSIVEVRCLKCKSILMGESISELLVVMEKHHKSHYTSKPIELIHINSPLKEKIRFKT